MKGIDGEYVRKIQTPQVFKGKQKVAKKSSTLKGAKIPPGGNTLFKQAFSSSLLNSDSEYYVAQGAFKGLSSSFTSKPVPCPPLTPQNPFFST